MEKAFQSDVAITFRQRVGGLPFINSNHGMVRVTVDNHGTITNIYNSIKQLKAYQQSRAFSPATRVKSTLLKQSI